MADRALSTSRRALLGAAAAIPLLAFPQTVGAEVPPDPAEGPVEVLSFPRGADRARWNEHLARYTRLSARAKAAAETGWFRAANDRYNCEAAAPAADQKAAFDRIDRAEDLYWRRCTAPMQQSAVILALTPAPDLAALLAKIVVMQEQELDELEIGGRPVLELLARDVEGLLHA